MTNLAITLLSLSLAVSPLQNDQHAPLARRGIAVFANASFDFEEGDLFTDYGKFKALDCSDNKNVCLKSGPFEFSLPRDCKFDANVKSIGDMRVIGTIPTLQHLAIDQKYYLLKNEKYPFIVYEYDPADGIVGLSYDILGVSGFPAAVDIEAAYKKGTYLSARGRKWAHSARLTVDEFAACEIGD